MNAGWQTTSCRTRQGRPVLRVRTPWSSERELSPPDMAAARATVAGLAALEARTPDWVAGFEAPPPGQPIARVWAQVPGEFRVEAPDVDALSAEITAARAAHNL
ncbi:hypothetical protein ABZ234_08490 [Nocardiopsis sp. NPDC006198]|uniref:hypothetical protein n=1 Tax=Nocardiopsis sp. NPDC006198 TaxID=3154472 RepID=UPI0033B5262A